MQQWDVDYVLMELVKANVVVNTDKCRQVLTDCLAQPNIKIETVAKNAVTKTVIQSTTQPEQMLFDPANGGREPYPSHAEQYRAHHDRIAWLYSPWSGDRRTAKDVGSDVFGILLSKDAE